MKTWLAVILIVAGAGCAGGPEAVGVPAAAGTTATGPSSAAAQSELTMLSTRDEIRDFTDYPSGPYLLGAGDLVRLKSLNRDFTDEEMRVSPDGTLSITSGTEVMASGKDLKTVEREINAILKKLYANLEIKLVLVAATNRKITLLGDVRQPGIMTLDRDLTIMDAIARAGGFAVQPQEPSSSLGQANLLCRIVRENGKSVWIDLKMVLFQNLVAYNVLLKNNDIVYIYKHF